MRYRAYFDGGVKSGQTQEITGPYHILKFPSKGAVDIFKKSEVQPNRPLPLDCYKCVARFGLTLIYELQ